MGGSGADLDTTTLTHYAEYLARIPDKTRVTRKYRVKQGGELAISSLDDCDGIRRWRHGDYFSQILKDYLAAAESSDRKPAKARIGKVGDARAELFGARDFVAFAVEWLEREFG